MQLNLVLNILLRGEGLEFSSPFPGDMSELLTALGEAP